MPYVFNPLTGNFDDTVPLQNGKVSADLLPSYVDDVLEYANLASFPATGETGKIYVAINSGVTYRWSGSQYVSIGSTVSGINDLSDVDTATVAPTNGQVLTWDSTASTWEPSTIDEVLEYANLAAFPATGEAGKIYVAIDTSTIYRWSGSAYTVLTANSSSEVLEFANLAAFPATGVTGKIYVAIDTRLIYRWSGSAYVALAPATLSSIDDIGNVTAVAPVNGATLVYNGNQWVPGAVIGGAALYTNAAAVIPFDGTTNVTAGTLVAQGFTGTVNVSGSATYDTTNKVLGSSSIYGANFANAGVYYGSSILRSFLASNSFTIEFWFRGYQNIASGTIFALQNSTGSVEYLSIKTPAGSLYNRTQLWSGGSNLFSSGTFNYSTWYHVAITHDVNTKQVKYFFNGILQTTITAVAALSADNLGLAITAKWNGSSFTAGNQQNIDYLVITPGLKYTDTFAPVAVEEGAYIPYNLSGLDDVTSTAPTNGQALVWNSGTSSWGPGTIDEVLEYANLAAFPATGESGKIYVAIDTKLIYRWSGSAYVSLANGSISGAGDAAISTTPGQGASLIYLDGKWRIGPVLGPKNTTTDPQWDNVKFLLKGNGSDGGTTFTDYSTSNLTLTRTGTTVTSTAQSKFNGAAIRFGYPGYTATNNTLYTTTFQNTIFPTAAADSTIEMWLYINEAATNTSGTTQRREIFNVIGQPSAILSNFKLYIYRNNGVSNWTVTWQWNYNTSTQTTDFGTLAPNQWHHLAIVKVINSATNFYINGSRVSSYTGNAVNNYGYSGGAGTFILGGDTSSNTYNSFNFSGYISDFRSTHGVQRYTGLSYTVPTATFPTAGDTNPSITYPISAHDDVADTAATSGQIFVWDSSTNSWTPSSDYISRTTLKAEVAASTDFANFQTRIAAL